MESTLRELGLTEKEIKVYLTLLSVGGTSASVLAYKTSISPSTIHYLCERLKEKGLVNASRCGNVIQYLAEGPEKILFMLERERCDIARKEEAVHRIMGELKSLMNPKCFLPKVRFKQGVAGMMEAYEEFLDFIDESENKLCHFINPASDKLDKTNQSLIELFNRTKKKKKFKYQCIFIQSPLGQKIKEKNNTPDAEIIFVRKDPKKHQYFYASLVSKGIVLDINYSGKDVLCTTIQHNGFASMRQELFDLAWQEAKRQNIK